jgi:hypothetical protein
VLDSIRPRRDWRIGERNFGQAWCEKSAVVSEG